MAPIDDLPPPPAKFSIDDLPPPPKRMNLNQLLDKNSPFSEENKRGNAVGEFLQKNVDPYAGAPMRAGVGALQEGNNPFPAMKKQFGAPAENAPTGENLVERAGVPHGLLSKGLGMAMNVATDPITYLPLGLIGKGVSKVGEGLSAAGGSIKEGLLKGVSKVGEAMTSVPEIPTANYIKRTPEINSMIEKYGGDVSAASDDTRSKFMSSIQNKRQALNSQITEALNQSPKDLTFDVRPILENIEKVKQRINPDLNPESISDISEITEKVRKVAGDSGQLTPQQLFEVKDFLQGRAKGSYKKSGQIYAMSKESQQAAKAGGASARKLLNEEFPEIASANNQHSLLHNIEEKISSPLITEGKNESGLLRAGSTIGRERRSLGLLEKATGTPMIEQAENLAAMKQFANPKLYNPAASRSAVSTGIGYLVGHAPGAMIGGAITSPAALKAAINAGRLSKDILETIFGMKMEGEGLNQAFKAFQGPHGAMLMKAAIVGPKVEQEESK